MKYLTGNQIRQLWLDFFKSKGHEIIPSASLIPNNDPTLLWINSGVAPLKKYFDGRVKPTNPRMCNAQKSIRTNDIENVGKTARHHTFFEMLGNFSVGDYFREEALTWAYELLFSEEWYGFDKNVIYITYYPNDTETYNKWLSLGIEKDHLVSIKDNFWEIGEGPCGPDTEIFYDRGIEYDPNHLGIKMLEEDIENDRYIEIWNIVFSQYNSTKGLERSQYPELPSKNIDTGSGLERLACIFQHTQTNYETDLFFPMIKFLEDYTNHSYHEEEYQMAFRVIVDHIRSVTFAIADGALLSNEGRGYVLRRILRRAVRYGKILGIHQPFLYQLVSVVIDIMKDFYPYLMDKKAIIEKIIKTEEENFLKTLSTGEKKLEEILSFSKNKIVSGEQAFLLYDTFGFPIELTEEISADNGFKVDLEGFQLELAKQKERARAARVSNQSMNNQNEEYLNFKLRSEFIGYETLYANSQVIAIFKDGKQIETADGMLQLVLDLTPFYAEMGGQIGDQGELTFDGMNFDVINTVKLPNGQHLQFVDMKQTTIKVGDSVAVSVNSEFRKAICQNHSATHLLNEALRKVLGGHVLQQGSQVTNENLRFDFNHYESLTTKQILEIEKMVRDVIVKDYPVCIRETTLEEAKALGAQALFGEKYGNIVRLVDMQFSKELCGGTHVKTTGEIKQFAITSIESKGSGIFRIVAVASDNLMDEIKFAVQNMRDDILDIITKIDKVYQKALEEGYKLTKPSINLPIIIGSYQDIVEYRICSENAKKAQKALEKDYENLKRSNESANYKEFASKLFDSSFGKVLVEKVSGLDINVLKDIVDKISNDLEKGVIFFANIIDQSKIIYIAKNKNTNANCGFLVKEAAIKSGGNGGGRADFAQSGGKDVNKVDEVLDFIREQLQ